MTETSYPFDFVLEPLEPLEPIVKSISYRIADGRTVVGTLGTEPRRSAGTAVFECRAWEVGDERNKADALVSGGLVAVGNGLYTVAMKEPYGPDPQWVRSQNGSRYVLDINHIEPALRARVPYAYREVPSLMRGQ